MRSPQRMRGGQSASGTDAVDTYNEQAEEITMGERTRAASAMRDVAQRRDVLRYTVIPVSHPPAWCLLTVEYRSPGEVSDNEFCRLRPSIE